ncbi:RTA1 like protein-domain-containing protein [Desarmillaria tabescens]|uniref:RTA1 like protein-domain-containing protein n=1 Tax=Armillaria tabescens TaxID=1929756 RepID=A0AA39MVM9_ARMTA|nr:RTA1 like protein-domain-containing protein [Desarmillaria tabescens]KAK0448337.1 RTA1 like protein-domain-containing protein [Desarmillaria tabescens]
MSDSSDSDSSVFEGFKLYRYTPSAVAAAIFCVIFLASTVYMAWKNFRTRSWFFTAMVVGGLMEGIGYIGRILSHSNPEALNPYIMQSILLLVAPALYAASIYVVLGRLMRKLHTERFSLIRINWLTKFFVTGDVLSFFVQSGGGGFLAGAKDQSDVNLGQTVIIVGLVIQILWFGGFILVSVVFHYRMRVVPIVIEKRSWRTLMYVLYVASAMIMVRSVFRVIEFVQGNDGSIMRNEVWLYIFDAVLMATVIVLFCIFHPSEYLQENEEEYRMGSRDREELAAVMPPQHYAAVRDY